MGVRGESSCLVHGIATVLVVAAAAWLRMGLVEWSLLLLCIAIVWSAELMNGAIERLARAVDECENAKIRDALDIASGAVSVAALGAAIVGVLIFGNRLLG